MVPCVQIFLSKGGARLLAVTNWESKDAINDSCSIQGIERGFVSCSGTFNMKKMF
jgi:hypothetical protein